jgi:tRNA pseudouridine38-40 synthase
LTKFRLTLEYDGAGFAGWQVQPGATRSVQGVFEAALARIAGHACRAVGASRTDAGVHAEGQVASVDLERRLDGERLRRALNGVLPPDLAVVAAAEAPAAFHARRSARSKLYRYRIWNGTSPSPLRAARSHRVFTPLDLGAMRRAASQLLGRHDFRSFQAARSAPGPTERSLARVGVEGEAGGEVEIWVEGDAFLRHMVRILAGTLVEVGIGRRDAGSIPALLAARERSRAGRTAPARGLCLVRVDYEADGIPSPGPGLPGGRP